MKLAIVGAGYVGLVSGVCLAAKGHDVICVDSNTSVVAALNAGKAPIFELGLPELLVSVLEAGKFEATDDLPSALDAVDLVVIAVGTPSENGAIDLTHVRGVAQNIGEYLRKAHKYLSIVMKSTVVPGTTDTIVREVIESASGMFFPAFGLGMNPEFLREGEAIDDFATPDRIVFGYEDQRTLELLEELYAPWDVDKVRVNTRTAELIKYANNALLATQISAMNEIANFASAVGGIDIMDVVAGVQLDKRWNPILSDGKRAAPKILTYLVPGCGFGGSCFPKDVQALRSHGERLFLPMRMMNAVLDVNEAQPAEVITILEREMPVLANRCVLVLGLAFKPGTDDVRESVSLKIVKILAGRGAVISVHDPVAAANFRHLYGADSNSLTFLTSWQGEVERSDAIVVATKWPEYAVLCDMNLKGKIVVDARRMFDPAKFAATTYLSIGRRPIA